MYDFIYFLSYLINNAYIEPVPLPSAVVEFASDIREAADAFAKILKGVRCGICGTVVSSLAVGVEAVLKAGTAILRGDWDALGAALNIVSNGTIPLHFMP